MPKTITVDEFVQLFAPGMKVFVQGGTGEPRTLLDALQQSPEASVDVEYIGCPIPGYNNIDPTTFHPSAKVTTFFMTPQLRRSAGKERVRFVPIHYSGIFPALARMPDLDFLLLETSGEVRDGRGSYGLTSEHAPGAAIGAKAIVAEMNTAIPYTHSAPALPWDRVDYVVETHRPAVPFPSPDLGEEAEQIGRNAASLIGDGAILQIGIGRLQSAVMRELTGHKNLGFHSGLISDETLALVECGALTGANKRIDPGIIVTGAVFGSESLHEFATDPSVRLVGSNYTHHIPTIAQLDQFVSINACMQVDLFGQVLADHIHGRQISAPGGYCDFQRGAQLADGGKSLVLMSATSADGKSSNIVASHPPGAVVTGMRADTDYIVTQFGVADLRNKDLSQRAAALIDVAAPSFREDLEKTWREMS